MDAIDCSKWRRLIKDNGQHQKDIEQLNVFFWYQLTWVVVDKGLLNGQVLLVVVYGRPME